MRKVVKFGGSSVANAQNLSRVVAIIQHAAATNQQIVVVSALGGITDDLLHAAKTASLGDIAYQERLLQIEQRHLETVKQLLPVTQQSSLLSYVKTACNELEDICNGIYLLGELSPRTQDRVVSFGELLSSKILAAALQTAQFSCTWKDARELIQTNQQFTRAQVDFEITNQRVANYLSKENHAVVVVPGFIAADAYGNTTTLGRGGSDYTAAILGAAVEAPVVEIWTDVSGMMTADPRLVSSAKVIPQISYQEAMELSHFGAKVIYPPTIQPLLDKHIPVWIKNTFAPEDTGTCITVEGAEEKFVCGISSISNMALLSLEGSGMVGIPGFSKKLFEALASAQINVMLITQGSSEHSICVGIQSVMADIAKEIVDAVFSDEIATGRLNPLFVERDLAVVALVGDHMKSHPGISGRMFGALGRNGINVRAIAQGSSERNISTVIAQQDVPKAVNVLHEAFFETVYKQLNVFIIGTGNVGSKLLDQLQQQFSYLMQQMRLQVRVVGIANSRHMMIQEEGIDLQDWKAQIERAPVMDLQVFVSAIREKNLRNSVFVDVTANDQVARVYDQLLSKSISVVACNKIAAASAYQHYAYLKELARVYNTQFLFETNVGAGLPIIGTLNDLIRSGDRVRRIDAVLSGTLNFVFNHYDASRPFADVVQQAQDEGYTEPDPRLDLGGTDVMRKILILAREAGHTIEMEQIANERFLPDACMQGSVADFYACMHQYEAHFSALYKAAAAKNTKLKFVASFEDGNAKVGLQQIDPAHNLYHLYGKDNVVLFYTDRYPDQPLVVKGAGAGADVTASGVFADILRASV